jgi:hypothetical protein
MKLPTSFISAAKHYLAGFISASINGGVSAVSGILGIDGAAVTGMANVPILDWRGMVAVFVSGVVIHGIWWLKSHPLPETYETTAPFSTDPTKPPTT